MACMLGEMLYNEGQDKQRIGSRLVQGSWDISGWCGLIAQCQNSEVSVTSTAWCTSWLRLESGRDGTWGGGTALTNKDIRVWARVRQWPNQTVWLDLVNPGLERRNPRFMLGRGDGDGKEEDQETPWDEISWLEREAAQAAVGWPLGCSVAASPYPGAGRCQNKNNKRAGTWKWW